jgi:hypothetical protein
MKLIARILLTCLLFVLTASCDPIHYIDFVNISQSNAKVKLSINSKTENYDLSRIAIGDSIVFNLKPKDTANIDFGIGNWSDKEIDEVLNSIKNIEIETEDITTIYKTKNSIKSILANNREGFLLRSRIEIEVK